MQRRAAVLAAVAGLALLLWGMDTWRPFGEGAARDPALGDGDARPVADQAPPTGDLTPRLTGLEPDEASPSGAPHPERPHISGRVVDAEGRNVSGARVIAAPETSTATFDADAEDPEGVGAARGVTDSGGKFALQVASGGTHVVWADAPGRGFGVRVGVVPGTDVVVELEATIALSGLVRDKDARAVPGAKVKAMLLSDCRRIERVVVADSRGRYRIEGLPTVGNRPGRPWRTYVSKAWFEVTAEGFAPLLVADVLEAATDVEHEQDFTLLKGSTLAGRVVDGESGAAVPGATVVLHSVEGMMSFGGGSRHLANPFAPRLLSTTTAAADGTFSFEHVPCVGPHRTASHSALRGGGMKLGGVTAWASGFSAATTDVPLAQDGAHTEVVLTLWRGAALVGRVVEEDGAPAGQVEVGATAAGREATAWIAPIVEGAPRSAATSEPGSGRFRIEAVPCFAEGQTEVKVTLRRLRPSPRAVLPGVQETTTVRVRAGETLDLGDLVVEREVLWPVTPVVVRRPDGTPVPGAQIARRTPNGWRADEVPPTDASGRVDWVWRPSAGGVVEMEVTVRAAGFAPTPVRIPRFVLGQEEDVVVVLLAAHRLEGWVVDAEGRACAGAWVMVADGSVPYEVAFPPPKPHFATDGTPMPRMDLLYGGATTDAEGRFVVEDLPAGPYQVVTSRRRRAPTPDQIKPLIAVASDVSSGGAGLMLRLPADDSPPSGDLEGRVLPPEDGLRPQVLWIHVLRGDSIAAVAGPRGTGTGPMPIHGWIEDDGRFRIDSLPVGEYTVRVEAGDFRPVLVERVAIREGETTRLPPVLLDRGIVVSGRVLAPPGHDFTGQVVWFRQRGTAGNRAPLDQEGRFRVTGLVPGVWLPLVTQAAWNPSDARQLLPAAGEVLTLTESAAEVRFDVSWVRAGCVILQVSDPRLRPPLLEEGTPEQRRFSEASRLVIRAADGRVVDEEKHLRNGSGGWHWLLPGRYVARLELPDGEVREQSVLVVAGETARVTFAPP